MKGLLYEHPAEDPRAQGLVPELRALFEAEDPSGRRQAPADRDLLAVLEGLEAGLGQPGEASSTSFLDAVARTVGRRVGTGTAARADGPRVRP
jgi:hypothetical protein